MVRVVFNDGNNTNEDVSFGTFCSCGQRITVSYYKFC